MNPIPTGRIYQDTNFTIPWFSGLRLEELIGMENPDKTSREPIIIYIKGEGLEWQQFFLDVCFGVWENWGTFEQDEDDSWYKNYAEEFDLKNQRITHIECVESQFSLSFENGTEFILRYTNPDEFDSASELKVKKSS